ncbi:MAG: hypothetical protein JWM85_2111 [Acidimicrobiaceae bacterium]|nr:hypothetical protein [Acidimicrobiaceae bacterium]
MNKKSLRELRAYLHEHPEVLDPSQQPEDFLGLRQHDAEIVQLPSPDERKD